MEIPAFKQFKHRIAYTVLTHCPRGKAFWANTVHDQYLKTYTPSPPPLLEDVEDALLLMMDKGYLKIEVDDEECPTFYLDAVGRAKLKDYFGHLELR